MKYRFYDLKTEEVFSVLQSDLQNGLTKEEALKRLKEDGKNIINPVQKAPVRGYILQVITDLTALLLFISALLLFLFEKDVGMAVLSVLLLLSYTVSLLAYVKAQKLLEKFGYMGKPKIKTLRNGKLVLVPEEQIVQGDVFLLTSGDFVPADARIVEAENLTVLESNLFDKDTSTKKYADPLKYGRISPENATNMVYASTVVLKGKAKAVAAFTGADTLVCRMKKNRPVAACHKLDMIVKIKKYSGMCGLLLAILLFSLTFLKFLHTGKPLNFFMCALATAVAAMPELYTAFAYIAVAFNMKNALYREETKTAGAFIKNPTVLPVLKMLDCLVLPLESLYCPSEEQVAEISNGREVLSVQNGYNDSAKRILKYALISTGLYGAQRLISKNERSENVYTSEQEALLLGGEQAGIYNRELEEKYPILDHLDKGEGGSFFETTLVHYNGQDVVVLRGDVENVLPLCKKYNQNGRIVEFDEYLRGEILHKAGRFAQNSRTVLAIATKNSRYNTLRRLSESQSDMIFEGLVTLECPLLPGGAKMISRCKKDGIRVIAYTLDENKENEYRAAVLGIASSQKQILKESELSSLEEEMFRIRMKDCTLLQGFDAEQLKFALDVLENDEHLKIGMLGRNLGDVYPLCSASVAFCEDPFEEGEKGELHTPVFTGKKGANRKTAPQALSYVSDVLIPHPSMKGCGSIVSIFWSMRIAKWIYRCVFYILSYLTLTTSMTLSLLICSFFGKNSLTPVQILVLSFLFHFIAVFVIALEKPHYSFDQDCIPMKDFFKIQGVWSIFGALLGILSLGMGTMLLKNKILTAEALPSFLFVTLILMSFGILTLFLRLHLKPMRDFHFSRIFVLDGLFTLLFLISLESPFGKWFDFVHLNYKAWLVSLAVSFTVFLLLSVLRILFHMKGIIRRKKK